MATDQSVASYSDFLKALLSDRERFFEEVVEGVALRSKLRYAVVTIISLAGFFGLVAGAYSGPAQAVSAGLKLPFLFFATFTVCFLITGANYYFQHLLNIAIAGVAGLFGMYALHEGLSVVCEKRGVYPRKALTIMRAWAVLFAFVGIQLGWSLRPFLGDRNEPFQVFGRYQGNFYAAIIYAVNKLLHGEEKPTALPAKQDTIPRFRGFIIPPIDTVADSTHRRTHP